MNGKKISMMDLAEGRASTTDVEFGWQMRMANFGGNGKPLLVFFDVTNVEYPRGKEECAAIIASPEWEGIRAKLKSMRPSIQELGEAEIKRRGYDMMPYINDFVPANITHLNPYFEIYNLDKEIGDKAFAVETHIERKENSRTVEGTRQRLEFDHTAQNRPVYTNIDISQLASGNYNLVVEVLSTDNQVYMSDAVAFQRSNPIVKENKLANVPVETSFAALITDEKELNYYLDALYPVASPEEVTVARALIKTAGLTEKQNFFFHFWERRNELDPQGEWNKYHELLKYVDATYSYPKTPGYMTDRGRVYLQYGPPDFIRDEKNFVGTSGILNHTSRYTEHDMKQYQHANDKTSSTGHIYYLPYQLWRYNLIAGDGRYRVFLFWDEFRSGYYKLLNSNAKGELQTPMWERVLSGGQLPEDAMGEVGEQFARGY